jgi:hypothetical protein
MAWDNRSSRFAPAEKGLRQKLYRARQDVDALTEALRAWVKDNRGKTPSLDALRKAQPGGKLPGRADGVDPWGRAYELRVDKGKCAVRCLGSDGAADTDDDVTGDSVRTSKPGWFERLFGGSDGDDGTASAERDGVRKSVADHERVRRDYDAAVLRAKDRQGNSAFTKTIGGGIDRVLELQANALAEAQVRIVALAAMEWQLRNRALRDVPQLSQLGDAARLRSDPWGNALRISASASGDIEVRSDGPDGKPDTADDVVAK